MILIQGQNMDSINIIAEALQQKVKREAEYYTIQECYINSEYMKILLKTQQHKLNTELALLATSIIESLESILPDQIKDVPREILKSNAQEILSYQEMRTYINCITQFRLIKTLLTETTQVTPPTRNFSKETQEQIKEHKLYT